MTQLNVRLHLAFISGALLLAACSSEVPETALPATPVTAVSVKSQLVEEIATTIGRLEAQTAPRIAAQTAGRVVDVLVEAGDPVKAGEVLARLDGDAQRAALQAARGEVVQLEALATNQAKRVERLEQLVQDQLISEDQFEDAKAQSKALSSQLDSARARLTQAQLNLQHTEILSPIAGEVQARHVSVGDFVGLGQVAFEVVASEALQAVFPVPQQLGSVVSAGQMVRLYPLGDKQPISMLPVAEVRPAVGARSRAVEVVVNVTNPGVWRAGASIVGEIILTARQGVVVPPTSVVRRPAGDVVYVINTTEATVEERVLQLGVRHADWVEVRSGLGGDELIVLDGAGFLTNGARVAIASKAEGSGDNP